MRTKEQTEKAVAGLREQIPEFVKKLKKIYDILDWKWAITIDGHSQFKIPTEKEIEIVINRDLDKFVDNLDLVETDSGGIRIYETKDILDDDCIAIEFYCRIDEVLE